MKTRVVSLLLLAALVCGAVHVSAQAKKPLTNQDVIDMVKGGLDEKTIVKAIETSDSAFDTTPQTLILLKNAGISEGVLTAMLAGGKPKAQSAGFPTEVGVYWMKKDSPPIEIGAEVVNFRTGGVGKMILTDGLDKGHTNGQIKGPHSKNRVLTPLEFVIVTYEGVTPTEYVLVKLDEKSDRREFRQTTGGVIHQSSGAGKNSLDFEAVKVAPRTYRISLGALKPGEYGILPPIGPDNHSAQGSGRIYSFTVVE